MAWNGRNADTKLASTTIIDWDNREDRRAERMFITNRLINWTLS